MLADPDYQCFRCPDDTRIERGCPHPLRDIPDRTGASYGEPSTCPVHSVPSWYTTLATRKYRIDCGYISADTLDFSEMVLIDIIATGQALAERRNSEARSRGFGSYADAEARRRSQEARKAALGV